MSTSEIRMSRDKAWLHHVRSIVAAGLVRLPGIDLDGDIRAQHQALRAATTALATRLSEALDARFRDGSGDGRPSIFRLEGITATSTSGLQQAMKNWLRAATLRLEKLQ